MFKSSKRIFMSGDPEFVALNEKGVPIPSHRANIPWKMEKAVAFEKDRWGMDLPIFSFFRDGYNVEFNVAPDSCRAILICNFFKAANSFLRGHAPKGVSLGALPAYEIQASDLEDAPDDVLDVGCNPSFDAYTGNARHPNYNATSERNAGGHMHFSVHAGRDIYNFVPHVLECPEEYPLIVKMLDRWVGAPLTYVLEDASASKRRRRYGLAGEFRPQKYPKSFVRGSESVGLEYRTPGPEMWIHRDLLSLAFGTARWVLESYASLKKSWDKGMEGDIAGYINEGGEPPAFLRAMNIPQHMHRGLLCEGVNFEELTKLRAWASILPRRITIESAAPFLLYAPELGWSERRLALLAS